MLLYNSKFIKESQIINIVNKGLVALALGIGIICTPVISYTSSSTTTKTGQEQTRLEERIEIATQLYTQRLSPEYAFTEASLKKYEDWINDTIHYSKDNNTTAIIIDKSEYTLTVLKGGSPILQFPIELGFNPYDDKMKEGDGTTPEGMYRIQEKKDKGETSFYRAFLIDYPNKQDKKEFRQYKEEGLVSKADTIGGLIEVHGMGSGYSGDFLGLNWTLGCVALSNEQMDQIFPLLEKQDRITIVKYGTYHLNMIEVEP
jgi:murein L,D-transpeptidase YafK